MSYTLAAYPFKDEKLMGANEMLESLEPLEVIRVDDHYTNMIYRYISLLTNAFNKEELFILSQMIYFMIKDDYYRKNIKCDFTVYIAKFIQNKFKNETLNPKDIMIAIYYIKYIWITDSVKKYFLTVYKRICNNNDYVFKEEDFNIFVERELPKYSIYNDVLEKIDEYVKKRKKLKN